MRQDDHILVEKRCSVIGPDRNINRYLCWWETITEVSLRDLDTDVSKQLMGSHLRGSNSTRGPLKMSPNVCPETWVNNYDSAPRDIPEERKISFKPRRKPEIAHIHNALMPYDLWYAQGAILNKEGNDAPSCSHYCTGKSNKYYVSWVWDCSLKYPACNAHPPYCHPWPVWLHIICQHYDITARFSKKEKKIERKTCFDFL